jgi:hypothetical protein
MTFLRIKNIIIKEKLLLSINFNWINLLVFTLFFVFPLMGLGTPFADNVTPVTLIPLVSFFSILGIMSFMPKNIIGLFDDILTVSKHDIFLFIYFFGLIYLFQFQYLNNYLVGDELSYAGSSQRYPLKLLEISPPFLDNFNVNNILHLASLILILSGFTMIRFLKRFNQANKFLILTLISLSFFAIYFIFYGGAGGYSRLNTFPYTITSGLFGVNPLIYRLTSASIICLSLTLICKFLFKVNLPRALSIIICTLFITIPLEIFHSIIVDHSIYFFVFAILPMLDMLYSQRAHLERYIPLLVIGIHFRASLFFVLFVYVLSSISKSLTLKNFKSLLPIVFLVPYGTALQISGPKVSNTNLQVSSSLFGLVFESLISAFGSPYLYFVCISLIYMLIKSKKSIFLGLYITLSFGVFFVYLDSNLIGGSKYQQEWFSPLLIISLINFARLLAGLKLRSIKGPIYSLILLLLFFQSNDLLRFNSGARSQVSFNVDSIATTKHYPIDEAYDFLEHTKYKDSCYNAGVTYNLMTEVFSGVNHKTYLNLLNQRNDIALSRLENGTDWTTLNSEEINSNKVSCVLITTLSNKELLVTNLLASGWIKLKDFHDHNFSTNVLIMVKIRS